MRRQRKRDAAQERVTPEVEALLAAVRRPPGPDAEAAAEAALAAFRAARDAGAHAVPSERRWRLRGRDDWRPSRRRGALPLKALLGSLVATVTLGGVALAAGTGVIPAPFGIGGGPDGDRPADTPTSSAPVTPGGGAGATTGTTTGTTTGQPQPTPSESARSAGKKPPKASKSPKPAKTQKASQAAKGNGKGTAKGKAPLCQPWVRHPAKRG